MIWNWDVFWAVWFSSWLLWWTVVAAREVRFASLLGVLASLFLASWRISVLVG